MVPRIHKGGRLFAGVVAYLTHDAHTADDRRPASSARVGVVEVENLPECDPETAGRIMHGTARDADELKRLAGVSTRGRKLDRPVYHYSLSWAPGERPSAEDKLAAARASLRAVGMEDRQALVIEHTDRKHQHVHVVVNRVSAEDGRAASVSHDARALSRWARTWEREHGGLRCTRRRATGLERVSQVIRQEPRPPPAAARRGPGRPRRTPVERRRWAALYTRERAEGRKPGERQQVAKRHRERRELEQNRERQPMGRRVASPIETDWDRAAADRAETQLPRVDGTLAVSDATFGRLLDLYGFDRDARRVIAAVQRQQTHNPDERRQAEQAYHRDAIDQEHTRLRAAHASAWRAGIVETPDPPRRRTAAEYVINQTLDRLRRIFEDACRAVWQRLAEQDRGRERQQEREQERDRGNGRER